VRRLLVCVLLIAAAACKRETAVEKAPAESAKPARPSSHGPLPAPAIASAGEATAPRPTVSTPTRCAGDGSYDAAVECFRMAAHLAFTITDVRQFRAAGEMTRPTPGMETVRFRANNGMWVAETKPGGLLWTHDGKKVPGPDFAVRIYQRTTLYFDPQKREGFAQRMDDDTVLNHYRFTNANTGELHDVWVSPKTGDIVRMRTGTWMMDVGR
jgi:hypothetical protein